jgi:carbamoyltransferase
VMATDPDLCRRVNVPRSEIPAVTHIDYSARVQTVDKKRHGRFYDVIRKFREETSCPVIINTSFNIRGEPIVCSPADAFRCFMNCEMDVLVLENFILKKNEQTALNEKETEEYKKQFKLD